jgi:hypothetical protein
MRYPSSRRLSRDPLHFAGAYHNFRRTARAARPRPSPTPGRRDRPARSDPVCHSRDRRQSSRARADQGARVQRHPRRARCDAGADLRQARRGPGAAHRQAPDTVAAGTERTGGKREIGTLDADAWPSCADRGSSQANSKRSRLRQGRQADGKIHTPGATTTKPHCESSGQAAVCRRVESAGPSRGAVRTGIAGAPQAPRALNRRTRFRAPQARNPTPIASARYSALRVPRTRERRPAPELRRYRPHPCRSTRAQSAIRWKSWTP